MLQGLYLGLAWWVVIWPKSAGLLGEGGGAALP